MACFLQLHRFSTSSRVPRGCLSRPAARSSAVHRISCSSEDAATPELQLLTRRNLMACSLLLVGPTAAGPASAGVDLDESKFTIAVPKGWLRGEGEAGTNRTVVAWHPPQETSTTVSVLNSLASVELTAITGLGSPYEFGFTVVYSQDRRARKKDRQIAELVDTQQRNGSYFIEYTIQRPEEGIFRRAPLHVYEGVTLKFDGVYNKLYTVTGVWLDKDSEARALEVRAAVESFRLV